MRSNPVSKGAKYLLTPTSFAQDKFSSCKAEEGGDAVASLTDDNETGGNLDKRNIWLIGVSHTRACLELLSASRVLFREDTAGMKV